jgi:hypothetical protein
MGRGPLVEGMPIVISQNYDVKGGIVNGTKGTLKSVRYETDDSDQRYTKSCMVTVLLNSRESA